MKKREANQNVLASWKGESQLFIKMNRTFEMIIWNVGIIRIRRYE